jgi:HTH-type transcriptional regulator/antitoxin HigA
MSASRALNFTRYRLLLGRTMPVAIQTPEEHERMLAAAERLMDKGNALSEEEGRLLKLLAALIEDYEQKRYPLEKTPAHGMVKYLLEEKNLRPKDLWPVLGSKSRVSEILSGKRAVSKEQARKLARFFHVSAELFI